MAKAYKFSGVMQYLTKISPPTSPYSKSSKQEYNRILMYRANLSQLIRFIFAVIQLGMGESNVQRSQNYLERNIENPQTPGLGYLDLVGNIHPYARVFMYILTAGRLILLLISIKHLSICKLYIYYEFLLTILNQFLPESSSAHDQALIEQLSQLHNFLFLYF